jgi:4-amino-4-deoxy-L-arabinose transferase-like glycosyltransferase
MMLYLALRLPHLRLLPIFCDEAAYLRWAQLIAADPVHNYWVSMEDAKLPLHYWILALVHPFASDPVFGGRLISVACGMVMIPLLFALGRELEPLTNRKAPWFAPVAALLLIASPLLAEYQRLALAESLLLLESVAILVLSLRLARDAASGATKRALVIDTLLLGFTWAATLLTKQNFSYLLWALPPLAFALHMTWTGFPRWLAAFSAATAMGVACFLPAVWSGTNWADWSLKLFYKSGFFRVPAYSRTQVVGMNLSSLLVPRAEGRLTWWPHTPAAPLEEGMLWVYLTPPVFLLLAGGVLWLVRRRQWSVLALFGAWTLVLLGPVVVNYNWIKTRYALLGILPPMLLTAWIVAAWVGEFLRRATAFRCGVAGAAVGLLVAWPLAATVALVADPAAAVRTRRDRAEYLADSSAGAAVQAAVEFLRGEADKGPIAVVTEPGFGLENDYVWLMLRGHPNVQLLAVDAFPLTPRSGWHDSGVHGAVVPHARGGGAA